MAHPSNQTNKKHLCHAPPTPANLICRMITLPSRVDGWQGKRRDAEEWEWHGQEARPQLD
ncbi:MAG: hypothetical protein GY943_19335 [Chloroflexi bacterium]|nr:hypothetical protein [Chloroflexota bacterium]